MSWIIEWPFLAFRQHFLERLKSPLLLFPLVGVWAAAALDNALGTSYLFWSDNWVFTCFALGVLSATWLWVSFLVDTGNDWLTAGESVFMFQRWPLKPAFPLFKHLHLDKWPKLTDLAPCRVCAYLTFSSLGLSIFFGLAHYWHAEHVPLPHLDWHSFKACGITTLCVFVSASICIWAFWLLSLVAQWEAINRFIRVGVEAAADVAKPNSVKEEVEIDNSSAEKEELGLAKLKSQQADQDTHINRLHDTAAIIAVVSTFVLFVFIAIPAWNDLWHIDSAATHLCILAMLLSHGLGFAIFRIRTGGAWFGLQLFVVAVAVFLIFGPEHQIRGLSPIIQSEAVGSRLHVNQALENSMSRLRANEKGADEKGASDDKFDEKNNRHHQARRPLVVVSVSGGGIRAQIWALASLCVLDRTLPDFARNCYLITGASGGMVGATQFVSSLRKEEKLRNEDYVRMLGGASRDALTRTFEALVLNDIVGAVPRSFGAGIWDRGRVLEEQWTENIRGADDSKLFEKLLYDFASEEKNLQFEPPDGWLPVLLYAPAIAEDGRRLIICNQQIGELVTNRAEHFWDQQEQPLLSIDSIHLKDIDPGGWKGITLATAARLNANFPFVVASPQIAMAPQTPAWHNLRRKVGPLHIMDGGYYDNYGINLAARWLRRHVGDIKKRHSRVLFIQIVSNARNRLTVGGESSRFPEASIVSTAFQKTTFLTDYQIHQLNAEYNEGNPDLFRFCSLEFDGPVSLNWSLTPAELYALFWPYKHVGPETTIDFLEELEERAKGCEVCGNFGDRLRRGREVFESRFDLDDRQYGRAV